MRIAYVIGTLDYGGAERHLVSLLPRLRALGWEPRICCLAARGAQASVLEAAGIDVKLLRFRLGGHRWRLVGAAQAILATLELALWLRRLRPEIVHFFLPTAYIIGAPAAMLAGVDTRVMSRRSLNHYQAGRRWIARVERSLHSRMSAVLANSRAVRNELRNEGVCARRLGLIYSGVDKRPDCTGACACRSKAALKAKLGVDDKGLLLICVANLIAYKGHADILAALARAAPALPPGWCLICAGRDDGILAGLETQCRDLGIEDHVRFLGIYDPVSELYQAGDMAVLASHQEGFSNAVLEGMAAGLPMVVTDTGGNAEAVDDGQTGYVVPVGDVARMAEAIAKLAVDGALRARFGRAARARAVACFSQEACVERYATLYTGLLRGLSPRDCLRDGNADSTGDLRECV